MITIKTNPDDPAGAGTTAPPTFEATDPMTGDKVFIPENLRVFFGHVTSFNRNIGEQQAKEETDKLKAEAGKLSSRIEELQGVVDSKGGEDSEQVEAIKKNFEKVTKEKDAEIEKLKSTSGTWQGRFESAQVARDIQDALSVHALYNPAQVADLLSKQGNAKPVEIPDMGTGQGTGKYETQITLSLPDENGVYRELTLKPKEAAEKFLSLQENSHHLKSRLSPGAGSGSSDSTTKSSTIARDKFEALTPIDQMKTVSEGVQVID